MKKKGKNISNIMTDVKFSDWEKWEENFRRSQKKSPQSFLGSWHLNFKKGNVAQASFFPKNLNILQTELVALKKDIKKQRIKFFAQVFLATLLIILGFWGALKLAGTRTFDFRSSESDKVSADSSENSSSLFWPLSGQRKYFVIFSDARMLRPFGGFFSNYALVNFNSENHDVKVEDFGSLYNLDGSFSKQFIPPLGLSSTTNVWSIHDSDFLSDFEKVSDLINFILQKNNYSKIDGLAIISTNLVDDFIQKYGSFLAQDQIINIENMYSAFGNVWEKNLGSTLIKPSNVLSEATAGLFKTIGNLSKKESADFLMSQIAQKNLFVSSVDKESNNLGQNIENFYKKGERQQEISILDLSHTIFQTPPSFNVRADFKKDGNDILEDLTISLSSVLKANSFLYIKLSLPSSEFVLENSYPQYAQSKQFVFSGNLEDYFTESVLDLKFFHDQTLDADVFMSKNGISFGKLLKSQDLKSPIRFFLRWKNAVLNLPSSFNLSIMPAGRYNFSLYGQNILAQVSPDEFLLNDQKYKTSNLNINLSSDDFFQ
jgi:hypothetical protein